MPSIESEIKAAQRELLATKRGMFGGARSYLETIGTSHVFTGSTSTDLTITLTFPLDDFPMLFAKVTAGGSDLSGFVTQRTSRYTWRVFIGGSGVVVYTIRCVCFAEQVPIWSIS